MTLDLGAIDGLVGEAWSGTVPDGSHVNMVLARRGSPTAAAALSALAQPRPGHAPLVVCLGAGNAVRPVTVMTNKAPATERLHSLITWGAAQLGVGQGVLDAVADGTLPESQAGDLVLLAAVWVDPDARDETAVRLANRDAAYRAIVDALAAAPVERVRELLALRDGATNGFYGGE